MARSEIDYYKILQVSRAASADEIKKSFRKLARDTHPDKNPNDPTAKERFQDLQRAYDTLKDDLTRSAYDADNPYHGLPSSYSARTHHGPSATAAGARSTTAKRYTASATPGWANGGATYTADGFAQQSARTSRSKSAYDPYAAPEYTSTPRRSTRNSAGYGYDTGGFGSREYEDAYGTPKQSAYSKTRQQETRREASPRPKSTQPPSSSQQQKSSTSARYTQQQQDQPGGPGIDIASYIQEKRAKELAKEKADQEARRKEEHAEHRRQQKERQAREETRRAQEEAETRRSSRNAEPSNRYSGYEGGDYSYGYKNSASQPTEDAGVPLQDNAEEMMRRAEEQLKASREQSRSKLSSKRSHGRKSKTPPLRKANGDGPSIYDAVPPGDTGSIRTDAAEVGSDYFKVPRPGAEYVSSSGHRVFPEPKSFDFNAEAQREKENRQPSPFFNVHSATPPPPSPSRMGKKPSLRRRKSPTTKKSNDAFRSTPDPFVFQESAANANPFGAKFQEFPFNSSQYPDYTRNGFGSQTANNSPDPQKSADRFMENPERPRSQPTQSSPDEAKKAFPWSPKTKQSNSGFKKELFEDLLKTAAPFHFQPSESTSSPRKRRSVPYFKKSTATKMSGRSGSADGKPVKVGVESDTEGEIPRFASMPTVQSPAPVTVEDADLPDPEPMDIADTPPPTKMPPPPTFVNGTTTHKKSDSKIDLSSLAGGLPSVPNPFNLSDFNSAPPLSRSPKDVGLEGLGNLKDTLPFPSQPSSKPPLTTTFKRPKPSKDPSWPSQSFKSSFLDRIPPTPLDPPFTPPHPPKILKIPRATSLETYNATYEQLGQYLLEWQKYEETIQATRAELHKKHVFGNNPTTPEDICKYLDAVKREDMVLDDGFRKARKDHVKSLESWMRLREEVIHMRSTEDGGVAAGGPAVGYGA